jgi:cullin-4
MPPSEKRKINDQRGHSASSSSSAPAIVASGQGLVSTRSQSPTSKRLKISHSAGNMIRNSAMDKSVGIKSRPGLVDLTRPSNFQPHTGAKRLVIKNLRTTSRNDVEAYYEKIWADLDHALTAVFNQETTKTPLEILCRGVEAICRKGTAAQLASHLKDRMKEYLEKQLLPVIQKESGQTNVDALRRVYQAWTVWDKQSVELHDPMFGICANFLLDPLALRLLLPRSIVSRPVERMPPIRRAWNKSI